MLMNGYISEGIESAFEHAVSEIKKNCRYSALNMLFSDGIKLYAYRHFTSQPAYYTLCRTAFDGTTVICSEEISTKYKWLAMDENKLFSV
jgi:glutamine amidotransferase